MESDSIDCYSATEGSGLAVGGKYIDQKWVGPWIQKHFP
jgi:hypothetical protein